MNNFGHFTIHCSDCDGMFYGSSLDPEVVISDAENINNYLMQGHYIKKTTATEIQNFFGKISCSTCKSLAT